MPPAPGDPGTGSLLGSAPRDGWYGPMNQNLDMAVMKNTPVRALGDAGSLQLRVEGFNVFNGVDFESPSANINSQTFGFITRDYQGTGRILQLAVKLNF
ncbi:MAG: hypothetical protein ACRD1C_01065 [Terriglobales bacterium]